MSETEFRHGVELWKRFRQKYLELKAIAFEIEGKPGRIRRGGRKKKMKQEPIAISGLWFRSNAEGSRITVLIEVDGKWQQVAELPGNAQGPTSHIIEPSGMRSAIEQQKPIQAH